MSKFIFFVFITASIFGSEVPVFSEIWKSKDVVFFLSTPKSGSNWIAGSLSAITRKPISWLDWKYRVFNPSSAHRNHPSYNRLGLPLVSDQPLLYRAHYEFDQLMQVRSAMNKLIFVTRNPKELLFKEFSILFPSSGTPSEQFIKKFLDTYLQAFQVYESWFPDNRALVFYEDFIFQKETMLLQLLEFMNEEPTYLDDFMENIEEYTSKLLASYTKQHQRKAGGASSVDGPKTIYHSKEAAPEILVYIDEYIRNMAPQIWEKYLKRFEELSP